MASVDAPYPEHMTILDNQSIESAAPDPSDSSFLQFKNRAGDVVSEVAIRDPSAKLTPALVRQGAFDFLPREVIVKDWYHPNIPNKMMPNPSTMPTSAVADLKWSPCGRYLAVLATTSPFIYLYKRENGVLTKLADPAGLPSAGSALSWSPNGQYLMVSGGSSGVVNTLYKRSGDTITRVAYDDGMFLDFPSGEPTAVDIDWSRDDTLLIWAGGTPGVFKRATLNSQSFTYKALTFPNNINGVSFSPTAKKFVLTSNTTSPYIFLYDYTAPNTITQRSAPAVIPEGSVYGTHAVAWSPDGKYVAIGLSSNKHGYIYKILDNGYWSLAAMTPDPLAPNIFAVTWHPSGKYVYFAGAPGTAISAFGYSFTGTALTPLSTSLGGVSSYTASVKAMQFSPDGKYLALGLDTSPYFVWNKSAEGALEGLLVKADGPAYEVKQS